MCRSLFCSFSVGKTPGLLTHSHFSLVCLVEVDLGRTDSDLFHCTSSFVANLTTFLPKRGDLVVISRDPISRWRPSVVAEKQPDSGPVGARLMQRAGHGPQRNGALDPGGLNFRWPRIQNHLAELGPFDARKNQCRYQHPPTGHQWFDLSGPCRTLWSRRPVESDAGRDKPMHLRLNVQKL